MERYRVNLVGDTPMLMNYDNIEWADFMKKWETNPENKKNSVAGDDRSPAWRWIGRLYNDNGIVVMSSDNLMTTFRNGGAKCPTGKGRQTFKSQSQSGILVDQPSWPLLIDGKEIPFQPIKDLIYDPDYEKHEQLARDLGFELFPKRATIPGTGKKNIRVRPRFDKWSCGGTITILDEMITKEVFTNILTYAGIYSGLGDWRPSAPKSPGRFGRFSVEVEKV